MFTKEALLEISNNMFFLFLSLNHKMINRSIMLKGLSVPPSHMKVIFYLTTNGPSPVSKIANDLEISKPNMTPIIDNLIAEGYAVRYDDPNDRRIINIKATEKAFNTLKQKKQETVELVSEKLSSLSDEDIELLMATIPPLIKILGKIK
ncbi:MarR family winged helix-turn-helix transcriptional regulator [Ruminiclostridium cellobioparum]|uniref:Transcriptional regulator n=1 Tax=Ruminiclostridium cellobioparum subsp. termitidis CT1112 TaxID=1195236 RepID=S0FJ70_RUMCE|nr:MarR family transcriptional regulator [Ruminiclostridium cellobioparum]EMS69159.1 transcriptional regulator [Ruminiclostridium cellobioparum subsp. termitidis CT1112]